MVMLSMKLSIYLLFAFCSLTLCFPVALFQSSQTGSIPVMGKLLARDPQCGFTGNPDIYGAGIRVGIYTQALAVGFANYFVPHEAGPLKALNTLFVFVMFIGTLFLSRTPFQTYAIEAFLLIQITFVIHFVGVTNASRYGRIAWKFSLERTLVKECSYLGMIVYNLWFWWVGLDHMRKTPCGTFVLFIVWKVNLYGWFRRAHQVLSILALCGHLLESWENLFRTFYYFVSRQLRSTMFFKALEDSLQDPPAKVNVEVEENGIKTIGGSQLELCAHEIGLSASQTSDPKPPNKSSPEPPQKDSADNSSNLTVTEGTVGEQRINANALKDTKAEKAGPDGPCSEARGVRKGPPTQFLPSFNNLYLADIYISDILAAGFFEVKKTRRWEISFFRDTVKLYLPRFHIRTSANQPSLKECVRVIKNAAQQNRMNIKALAIGIFEIYSLRTYFIHQYPWGLHAALTHPSHQTQDWRTLVIISDIRRSREKPKTRRAYWVPYAAQTILLFVGLILATELHIHWNHILGVRSMDSVGQLIPMLLGVGGLLKVLWAKGKMVWRGTECTNEAGNNNNAVATAYYRQKEIYEDLLQGSVR